MRAPAEPFYALAGTPLGDAIVQRCQDTCYTCRGWTPSVFHRWFRRQPERPSQLMIDVGALDGVEASMYLQTGHRVLTFEPAPSKQALIRKRLNLMNRSNTATATLLPFALSNFSGTAAFRLSKVPKRSRLRKALGDQMGSPVDSFVGERSPASMGMESEVINVPVRTLDSLVPQNERVLYLKIDTQGFDYRTLLGARGLLSARRVGYVKFELYPAQMPGGLEEAVESLQFMENMGYNCLPCSYRRPRAGKPLRRFTALEFVRDGTSRTALWFDDVICKLASNWADDNSCQSDPWPCAAIAPSHVSHDPSSKRRLQRRQGVG
jgi:FkbM family methyltransferase